jgi:protein TonB
MNRLTLGIVVSIIFHLALLNWAISRTVVKPSVNVSKGKTSIAMKFSTPETTSEPKPKEPKKVKEKPEKKKPDPKKPEKKKVKPEKEEEKTEKPKKTKKKKEKKKKKKKTKKKSKKSKKSIKQTGAKMVKKVDYLQNPSPEYPAVSKRRGEEGTVILRVVVDAEGNPESVIVKKSSGHDRLDEQALKTVRQWKFTPAKNDGYTFRSNVLVPIVFELN